MLRSVVKSTRGRVGEGLELGDDPGMRGSKGLIDGPDEGPAIVEGDGSRSDGGDSVGVRRSYRAHRAVGSLIL